MELISIFFSLLALGFVLWILGVAALYVLKVVIGFCSIPFLLSGDSPAPKKESAKNLAPKTKRAVKLSFSSDNSFYIIDEEPEERKIKRYSANNIIFSLYKENSLYLSNVENLRMGQSMNLKATNATDMIRQIESYFSKWSIDDPGRHFTYD